MASLLPLITHDFTKAVGSPERPKGFWRFIPLVNTSVFIHQIVIEADEKLDISNDKRIVYRVFKSAGAPLPPPPEDAPTDAGVVPPAVQIIYPKFASFRDKSTEPVVPYNGVRQYMTKFLDGSPMEILGPPYERIEIFLADANNVYLPDAKFDVGSVAVARFKAAVEAAS